MPVYIDADGNYYFNATPTDPDDLQVTTPQTALVTALTAISPQKQKVSINYDGMITLSAATIVPDGAGSSAGWTLIEPTLSTLVPGIFTQSETGIPVVAGEVLMFDMVGGGPGGAGGGSIGGGATPNAAGGGGGGTACHLWNIICAVPPTAVTMDVVIGAGGAGGAVGAPGNNGTDTTVIFRNSAGTQVALDTNALRAYAIVTAATPGGSAAAGVQSTGGTGSTNAGFFAAGGAGGAGVAGGSGSGGTSVAQVGWGNIRGGIGAGGGGVSAGNVGAAGGSSFFVATGVPNVSGGTSPGGAGAGALGGGGSGTRSTFGNQSTLIPGGAGGVAGTNANTAATGGLPSFGSGGGGGGGNAAGGAGAQGAARIYRSGVR